MPEAHRCFLTESFQVTDRSDRMGYQLSGPVLKHSADEEMLSTGVCQGTVQVTHAGVPVILMADGQTTGGYPRIAQIITADIALCGQRRPGSTIRFIPVSAKESLALLRSQTNQLLAIERSIRIRYGM
jgi:antagonist of KipI